MSAMSQNGNTHLVNELATMDIVWHKDLCPKLKLTTLYQVPSLLLEHRVLIGNVDKFFVAEALCVSDICQVRIPRLAKLSNNKRLVEL